ncbi:MAG: EAL domain-containing protein [Pontibacterium sp.]
MKFSQQLSLSSRFTLTNIVFVCIALIGISWVINALYKIETQLREESSTHITTLTTNSVVSREIFELATKVQLLEQAFLYNEAAIRQEGFEIEERLQRMRSLSSDAEFNVRINVFIEDFHRFLGSSLALNRILKQLNDVDKRLEGQIDELDAIISQEDLYSLRDNHERVFINGIDGTVSIRETYLNVGKMVGSIRQRITPDIEKVIIIEIIKELGLLKLYLSNLENGSDAVQANIKSINQTLSRYNAVLRKVRANLDQRWIVMGALVSSQNALISFVETTEKNVELSAIGLKDRLEKNIADLRFIAILAATTAAFFSLVYFSHLVRTNIRRPLDTLLTGIEQVEANEFGQQIKLNRSDEWATIEHAFNDMAKRLDDSYKATLNEKSKFDYLAHHDPLTGLENRLFAYEKLDELISESQAGNGQFCLLYMDIDGFKNINDSMGHEAGDELLKAVAQRIISVCAPSGLPARLGGDEFMVLLPNLANLEQAQSVAAELCAELRKPYNLNDDRVFVSSSIGICQYPEHGNDAGTLVRNADTAMYTAKHAGRDQFSVYHNSMTQAASELVSISSGIRRALANNEFEIVYQPQYDLRLNQMIGAEALIRWNDPERGFLSPFAFLPVAERTGLIEDIDDWVFNKVLADIKAWQALGIDLEELQFSVNFSGRKFLSEGLAESLYQRTECSKALTQMITLEITEQDMMTSFSACSKTIKALRTKGFRVAIDDFGIGYSSLASLKNLPATSIKIDRSFVKDLETTTSDIAIITSVINLANQLGLQAVAEGIETPTQAQILASVGCKFGQGYLMAKPMSHGQFSQLLNQPARGYDLTPSNDNETS